MRTRLERVAQGEFHDPRTVQGMRIISKAARNINFRQRAERIETHGVRQVKRLRRERETLPLGEVPGLPHSSVHGEIPGPAQDVAAAYLSGEGIVERGDRS